ncbi:MAG: GTPase ObgE [Candidatus Pacebacteria bacterium]|nr:GTPase ObgE [Candidatus Paceibacterota bacterium]
MFVDELRIYAKAGKGGNGVVRWLHYKGKEFSGPSGGNGGNGASVFVRATRDLNILQNYLRKSKFYAEDGEEGMKNSKFGKNGDDLFIDIPIGSVVTNLATKKEIQLLKESETYKILQGGRGGLGNEHFKSSRNTTPLEWTPGTKGEGGDFFIEIEIIADAGFVGFANIGKSTLLNELTHARAKVKNYPFTTLDPNLGDFYGFILADIPGLIEGAAQGKGLGHKFLRHIKRTNLLIHCISLESENSPEEMVTKYKNIRKELEQYDKELTEKTEIIVLTKSDLLDSANPDKDLKKIIKALEKLNSEIIVTSAYDDDSIKKFSDFLIKKLEKENI